MAGFGGKLRVTIGANTSEIERSLKNVSKNISNFGKQLTSFGKDFSIAISGPLAAWGAASAAASLKIKDALNDVAVGTGATGVALEGLKADFRAVAGQVPDDMSQSAKAIADLNTLLGVAGTELQEMAKSYLNLSRITKTDLSANISSISKMMRNWGIDTSRTTEVLDKLLVASQYTGISISDLAKNLTENGTAARTLGYDFENSIALLGTLDKAGVETGKVMTGLQRVLGTLAEENVKDMGAAFEKIIEQIKTAPDMAQAVKMAGDVFGKLVDTQMAAAIREGNFELRDFVTILHEAGGTLNTFVDEAEGFSENWGRITNQFTLALEPLGNRILKIAQEYMPSLTNAIEIVNVDFSDTAVKIGMLVATLGPATLALGAFTAAVSSLVAAMKTLYVAITGPVGIFIALSALGVALLEITGQISDSKEEVNKTTEAYKGLREQVHNMTMEQLKAQLVSAESQFRSLRGEIYRTQSALASLELQRAKIVEENIVNSAFGGELPFTKETDTQISAMQKRLARTKNLAKEQQTLIEEINLQIKKLNENPNPKTEGTGGGSSGKTDKTKKSKKKSSSGKSALDFFIENVQDRMKYFKEDGSDFIEKIQEMQSKLKPLSEDWKKLEDLRLEIDTTVFDKSLQDIQDQMKYLDQDGAAFLPQLQDMSKNFDLLSEKGKKIADVMKPIMEELYTKKWSTYSWEFSEGLLKAADYIKILKTELSSLTEGTDKWRARFSELQNVQVSEISKVLEELSTQFQSGKIQNAEYESALQSIIQEFSDLPRVVQLATEALKAFHKQNELTTLSTRQQLTNALKSATKDFKELQGQGILGVVEGFLQASIYGDDFGESLKKLGQDIVYTTLKMIILAQLTKWLGSAFGSSFGGVGALPIPGLSFNENGNVFDKGYKLTAYAKGGLVNRPTVFSMPDGLGLMGEAGTEAIMPLKRDGSGRLGVYAQIQGNTNAQAPTVIINVENQSSASLTAEQSGVSFNEQFNKAVVQVVLRDQAVNGPITRNFRRR